MIESSKNTKQCKVFFSKLKLNTKSTWITRAIAIKVLLSPRSFKPRKNIPV